MLIVSRFLLLQLATSWPSSGCHLRAMAQRRAGGSPIVDDILATPGRDPNEQEAVE
jgi:hypothetical protein